MLATFSIHTARAASRRPSVVVMQAIEDGECYDPTVSIGWSTLAGTPVSAASIWAFVGLGACFFRDL